MIRETFHLIFWIISGGRLLMKTLVLKLGALGDVLRVTPVIHSLHDRGHDIDVITSVVGADVFNNNPYVKNTYRIRQKRNAFELYMLRKNLRKSRFDNVINFESRKTIRSVFEKLNCNKYLGCENLLPGRENVNAFFYKCVRELIEPDASMYPNELFPSEEDIQYVDVFLSRFGAVKKVGIHVGTSKTNRLLTKNLFDVRLWPIDNYIKLIKKLVEKGNMVFLTGSRPEKTINEKIVRTIGNARVVDTSGKFNIQQLQALIAQMDWFISGDTGPAHVAASVPVKQICLCGPTDADHSAPWKTSNLYRIQKNPDDCPPCYATDKERKRNCRINRCMMNITVEDVLKIIRTHRTERTVSPSNPGETGKDR